MRDDRPSRTASWVAGCRALGALLPDGARLVDDPFGLRFGWPGTRALVGAAARAPRLARLAHPLTARVAFWIQVRTRALDDILLDFARAGGRQVLLLGAGFDCRAARFRRELAGARVFEVDHPATQARKRLLLGREHGWGSERKRAGDPSARSDDAGVAYVAWDFERDRMRDLPSRLASAGHDAARPTLTIWEGVTMYLTEPAIDVTVRAVRALSAPGSPLAITYFDRALLERPGAKTRLVAWLVARGGEPWRFGWDPPALPAWLAARGFALESDRDYPALADEYVPVERLRQIAAPGRHVALARAT